MAITGTNYKEESITTSATCKLMPATDYFDTMIVEYPYVIHIALINTQFLNM